MFDMEPKIVTAFGVGQREVKLVITNHDYPPPMMEELCLPNLISVAVRGRLTQCNVVEVLERLFL